MPTAFTYQGQLKRAGTPLNGPIDARFSLWMHSTGQSPEQQIGSALALDSVEVANGLFNVELDFGQDALNGNARWLQIEIHDHADPPGTFTTLTPRQPLTPTPYALQTRGIVVTDNGNVGIGTKSPATRLHIKGAVGEGVRIDRAADESANAVWVGFYDSDETPIGYVGAGRSSDPRTVLASYLGDVQLYTSSGPAVTAKPDGTVGIGTTAPVGGLHIRHQPGDVGGTLALEGSTYTYLGFFPQGVAAGRKAWLGFGSPNTNNLTLGNEAGGDIRLVTQGNVTAEDVVVTGKIDIGYEIVVGFSTGDDGGVLCPTGKRVIGGGCDCRDNRIMRSMPFVDGWFCVCDGTFFDVYAICARVK
jgi:hypothetical protein